MPTAQHPAAPAVALGRRPRLSPALERGLIASAITLGLVLVLVLGPAATRSSAASMFGTLRAPGEAALIAGHRGDRSVAPENTVAAFEAAIAGTMIFVETDVRLSADGIPVLIHDETVDRTTDGTGRVADLTLAQLTALDAGSWYGAAHAGARIPTLDQFLALLADSRKKALIELKGIWTAESAAVIDAMLSERGVRSRVVLASFEPQTLQALQAAASGVPRVLISRDLPADPVAEAARFGAIALVTNPAALERDPAAVDRMHAAGLGVLLYTLNKKQSWGDALALGVDGIITDKPSTLDGWLAATAPGT